MSQTTSKRHDIRSKTHKQFTKGKNITIGIFRHEILAFHYRDPERKAGFLQKKVSDMIRTHHGINKN